MSVRSRLPRAFRPTGSNTTAFAGAAALALLATLSPLPLSHAQAANQAPTALPAVTPRAPIRLVAANKAVRDTSGNVWQPDRLFAQGGRLVGSLAEVRGTANPALYQRARLGVTGYRIPVRSPGTYFVDLFTAELRGARPGHRVWNVTAEGHTTATSVDVRKDAGPYRAWHVMFPVVVTDGLLNLHVVRRVGQPVIGAVEVDYQSSSIVSHTVFQDEFNGPAGRSPSPLRWTYETGGNGWGNNELETYTDRKSNVSLDGHGHLAITARKEQFTGADHITRDYTSARINTAGRFSFRYGRAVARISVPKGRGLWPAFWALGDNISTVGWPLCGEIDVMEHLGSQPHVVHAVVHAGHANGGGWLAGSPFRTRSRLAGTYHAYELTWGPSGIAMAIDGRTYMTVASADLAPQQLWNFGHPFHLLLNLAVGGTWPGSPGPRTPFPAVMSVDSVRVWS